MPYKFVYFPVRGRGQAFKYLCADNDITFEDEVLLPCDMTRWADRKQKTILGQLPLLFDGDFEIGQSNAILRHIARLHDLYGKDEEERTLVDMINDQQEELRGDYSDMIYNNYEAGKQQFIEELPDRLEVLEKMLGRNNNGRAGFVGSKQTFVDYNVFDLLDDLLILSPHCLDDLPLLEAFHARIASREKISRIRQTDAFKYLLVNGNGKQ